MPFGNGCVKMKGLFKSVLCLLIPAVMYGLGSEMSCTLQQFPGNYRALTSKPASWGAQSRCCCPQILFPLWGVGILVTLLCCRVSEMDKLGFWDLSATKQWYSSCFRLCIVVNAYLCNVWGCISTCPDMSWWVSMCPGKIPNLKHMLVTAWQASLTRPSNVSPHSQLRVNFDTFSSGGTDSILNACDLLKLSFTPKKIFSKGVFVHFGQRG